MILPGEADTESFITRILTRARDEDRLGDMTVRTVVREVGGRNGLTEDDIQNTWLKPFIKKTVYAIMNSFNVEQTEGTRVPERKADEGKQDDLPTSKPGKRARSSTAKGHSSDKAHSEREAPPTKKASARARPAKVTSEQGADDRAKPSKTTQKPKSDTDYKSKASAVIESSDEEAGPESSARKPSPSLKKKTSLTKSTLSKGKQQRKEKKEVDSYTETNLPGRSPKTKTSADSAPQKPKQRQQKADKEDSDVEMDNDAGSGPSGSGSKPKSTTESPKRSMSKAQEPRWDPMESESSSVIDEPPTKRQKKQEKEIVKSEKDRKPKLGKKDPLSKEEETINKLKSIVVGCGVRKAWKKEFEGLDRPSQQIKRLHSILGDLGMTPRYSMEKAKAIKERRELAQELKEVQEFDKAMKKRGKERQSSSESAKPADKDDSDEGAHVPARKKNARASIMAFLQDQSGEE